MNIGRQTRLLLGISVFWLALSVLFDGVNTLVLPIQVSGSAGHNQATVLGLLTFVGLLAGALVQPVAGAFSDRLQPLLGRKGFIGIGLVLSLAALLLFAVWQSMIGVLFSYLAIQVSASIAQAGQHRRAHLGVERVRDELEVCVVVDNVLDRRERGDARRRGVRSHPDTRGRRRASPVRRCQRAMDRRDDRGPRAIPAGPHRPRPLHRLSRGAPADLRPALGGAAALGALPVHPGDGLVGLIGSAQAAGISLQASAEGDDIKAVVRVEMA